MCIDISFFNIMDVHDNIMDVVTLIMVQVQSIRLDTIYLMSAEVYDFGLQFT